MLLTVHAAACDEASWAYSVLIVLHVFLVTSTSRELSELESLGIFVHACRFR
jgi:hypothetical protein